MTQAYATTIKLPRTALKGGVVVLSMKEYTELKMNSVPTYYLKGKKAEKLDKMVAESLRDHKAGKTTQIRNLADLR